MYQPLHGRDQDGDGKDGDLCRLQMQQWLRGNFSYSSGREGDSVPHDIGFRGSKSMVRVSAMADGSPKLVVCVRLTKAQAQLLKDTPGGADTLLEVHHPHCSCGCLVAFCLDAAAGPEPLFAKQLLLRALGHVLIHRRQQVGRAPEGSVH